MNSFIRLVSRNVRKDVAELAAPEGELAYQRFELAFAIPGFYYNNGGLFRKPENGLPEICKSLLILEDFKYEWHVISEVLAALSASAHVHDLYFVPVGWLLGAEDAPDPSRHVVVRFGVVHGAARTVGAAKLRAALEPALAVFGIRHYALQPRGTETLPRFSFGRERLRLVCVVALYPFDPRKSLAVVYAGRYRDSYCGLNFVFPQKDLPAFLEYIADYVHELHVLNDRVSDFERVSVAVGDGVGKKTLPHAFFTSLCELAHQMRPLDAAGGGDGDGAGYRTYVPRQYVSLLHLPCDVPIACRRMGALEVVTHIDGRRADPLLVCVKDPFLRDASLDGVFKKRNVLHKNRYTYCILDATFECPRLRPKSRARWKGNYPYATRALNHIV
ncbi:ORF092 [Saltwater crocodilepox virus]|nr:telomere binding protein [Saltwater crocodilepox virus]AVD69427.1 telomere binding protein [Saltwater crocodilepox virus]QGT46531.1 ORF092 [Saltwater crocodilepox virus]QGT46746.1 ORF092 [Saltwater crocodilepox virus]QGT46962.1 ORF092 [Saltwater crocodilepox virus]